MLRSFSRRGAGASGHGTISVILPMYSRALKFTQLAPARCRAFIPGREPVRVLRTSLAVLLTSASLVALVFAAPIEARADAPPPRILINELANGGPNSDSDTFFELRNWGGESVDLTGWHVYRCS